MKLLRILILTAAQELLLCLVHSKPAEVFALPVAQ